MPNSLGFFKPTGLVPDSAVFSANHPISSGTFPPLYLKCLDKLPPRAANSHSASVGSLHPIHCANSFASNHETLTIG